MPDRRPHRTRLARRDVRALATCAAGWLGCEPGAILAIEALLQRLCPVLRAAIRALARMGPPAQGDA